MAVPMISVLLVALFFVHASAITICVSSLPGGGKSLAAPTCNAFASDPYSFRGPDVEVWRAAAASAGWQYDPTAAGAAAPFSSKRYAFRCLVYMTIDQIGPILMSNFSTARCHGFITGGMHASSRLAGLKAAQPHIAYPYSVVVYDEGAAPIDTWAFIKPLDWKLWFIFTITIVVLPFLIWFIEKMSTDGYIPLNKSSGTDLRFAVYRNILAMFTQDIMFVTTTGAQVTMITFLLLTFVTISTYTASLASFLTLTNAKLTANSLKDFAGTPIAISLGTEQFVESMYGITNYEIMANTAGESVTDRTLRLMKDLRDKRYNAVFMQRILIESALDTLADPKFQIVGKDVEMLFLGFFFHDTIPDQMLAEIDGSLLFMRQTGLMEAQLQALVPHFYRPTGASDSAAAPIVYKQMFGLFLILYGTLGAALLYTVFVFFRNRLNRKVGQAPQQEVTADQILLADPQYNDPQQPTPKPPAGENTNPGRPNAALKVAAP